ncbi:MAG: O-acetylhomoserine aminocarboxypropyltransferase/cysteine synthase [Clostridia bacterium]|nr:O-acetylhomoserine aminocarboxypropyltransferase/cysteine synthase [Clostridia bacterium]
MKKESICLHGGYTPKSGDANVLPIYQSTTYAYDTPEELAHLFDVPKDGHIYTRISNPTVAAFEEKMALLEGGVASMMTSSGQAATLTTVLTVAKAGDNILAFPTLYGGTFNLLKITLDKLGIECRFIKPGATDAEIEALIDEKTKLMFGETIANPAMDIFDFDRFVALCKKHGILLAVDNTLATPCLVTPIKYGVNVVVHSTTKYLDGHAVAVGGLIVDGGNFEYRGNPRYTDFVTPDESYHGTVYVEEGGRAAFALKARMQLMRDIGVSPSPFNAFLTNLGTETLALRMKKHSENALEIAKRLKANPHVSWVKYCGLPDDENHEMAAKYFEGGFGGMVCFGVKGGRAKAADFIRNLGFIRQLTHIADSRTCVLHPASTTHRQLSDKELIDCGIGEDFIRLSVGLESADDIYQDIEQSLNK